MYIIYFHHKPSCKEIKTSNWVDFQLWSRLFPIDPDWGVVSLILKVSKPGKTYIEKENYDRKESETIILVDS